MAARRWTAAADGNDSLAAMLGRSELTEANEASSDSDKSGSTSQASRPSLIWRIDALDVGDRLAASAAAKKGSASVDSIVDLVQSERERWEEEKQALETRLEELKQERAQQLTTLRRQDPEKEDLKQQLQELRKIVKTRSRFGAWVCERHMQESDDEGDDDRNADKEVLRTQLAELEEQLRKARREAKEARASARLSRSSSA